MGICGFGGVPVSLGGGPRARCPVSDEGQVGDLGDDERQADDQPVANDGGDCAKGWNPAAAATREALTPVQMGCGSCA